MTFSVTQKCCGNCKFAALAYSRETDIKCQFVVPIAFVRAVRHGTDCSSSATTSFMSGSDCPCFSLGDMKTSYNGKWKLMKKTRTIGRTVNESQPEQLQAFSDELSALRMQRQYTEREPTKWNDKGSPFVVYYVKNVQ